MPEEIPTIRRSGIIFRPGNYGAKGNYTDADIDAMAGDNHVPVNIEHRKSVFDGKLGSCIRRWSGVDDKGDKVLLGEWDEPLPLTQLLGNKPRPASIELDMATKQVTALAITYNPHIPDAALFNAVQDAYAKFSRGEEVAEFRYESTAERDAIASSDFADPANQLFPVRTQQELRESMREVWNAADPTMVKKNILDIAARKGLTVSDWLVSPTYGISKPMDNDADDSMAMYSAEEKKKMENDTQTAKPTPWEHIKAMFGFTDEQVASAKATFEAGTSPRELELLAENAKLKKAAEDAKTAQFNADTTTRAGIAKTFAAELVTQNLILPAQADAVTAEFTRALDDDAREPKMVTFSVESEGAVKDMAMTRADSLKAHYLGRRPHTLTEEVVQSVPPEHTALFAREATRMRTADQNEVRPSVLAEMRANLNLKTPAGAASNGHN